MYINKTEAETIFELLTAEDQKLSHDRNRLNFIMSREAIVELMEKIAPTITDDGWTQSPEQTARAARKALENDREERRLELLAKLG